MCAMTNISHKILLINPSGWQKGSINLGLTYLSASLKRAGYAASIIDLNLFDVSDAALLDKVRSYSPFIIGLSAKTATANEAGRIANLLSAEFADVAFVAGGPHLTLCAETFMESYPVFHYAIMGEGEESIVQLAHALAGHASVDAVSGLVYRRAGQIVINNWEPPADLDSLSRPDLDSIEQFTWNEFRYPVLTSRGCPFDCTYCCVNKLTGSRKWRSRSAQNVLDELEYVAKNKGVKLFEVWDDNFTLDIRRAKEICVGLLERRLDLSWYCHNGIRADRIDQELANLMKKAGCTSIAFGIESGDPDTFDSIKKGEPLSAVVNAVEITKRAGIKAIGYFIIGLPGDTLEKFIETVRFQRSLKLDHYVFGMLIPYPKTEVWDIVQERGTMFCDITETQHFSNDIVPISFDLPEFPKRDMIRAFYIAKFFPLYEAVERVMKRGHIPIVVYHAAPDMNEYLFWMFIACHPVARHIVVGGIDKNVILNHPFLTLFPSINVTFQETMPRTSSAETVHVCIWYALSTDTLISNSELLVFEPSTANVLTAKKHVQLKYIPKLILSMIGIVTIIPNMRAQVRFGTVYFRLFKQPDSPCRRFLSRISDSLFSLAIRFSIPLIRLASRLIIPLHMYRYSQCKQWLKKVKLEKKRDFPYDDYSSYL
jgi:anaerobic magnesium-protoporphyrin IX monomethyl ester cyclase